MVCGSPYTKIIMDSHYSSNNNNLVDEEPSFEPKQTTKIDTSEIIEENMSKSSDSSLNQFISSQSTLIVEKSFTRLEDKFKKYVSSGDLLMKTLSTISNIGPVVEDLCDSTHLLERNTESFKCLAQMLLSSSSLTRNRLFLFPPLDDPGIEVAFNFEEPPTESDDYGVEKYKKVCKDLDIVPISRIIYSLPTDTLDLKYYGLTSKQIRALTEALKANAYVQHLILQDNWLTEEMTQMVSDMIVENISLQELCLYECRIGEEDDYGKARAKARLAEKTSDLASEACVEEHTAKRKRVQKLLSSSESSIEENEYSVLPSPPKLKRNFLQLKKKIDTEDQILQGNPLINNKVAKSRSLNLDNKSELMDNNNFSVSKLADGTYCDRCEEKGAQKLGEVLSSLQSLRSLDLSFNELGDKGLLSLRDGLCGNTSLKKLNLSHNNITEDSADTMEKILLENKNIEDLDLSWSGFFTAAGNKKLFGAFLRSDRIKTLHLAWNGIGTEPAVKPLARYIRNSENLEELDLSNNRLGGHSLRLVRGAINKNHSLKILKIGNNIYPPGEAHLLLTMLGGKGKDPLFYMDMENMYVNKESKSVLAKIYNLGKIVKIGGILSNYEIHGPDVKKLIYARCKYILMKPKKAKARKDFGHFILTLPDRPISPEDFQKELKKMKIKKLDQDLVQGLMNLFMNKKKQVDCQLLVQDYMTYYPDTELPPPKPKKGKKGKQKKAKDQAKEEEKEIKIHDLENTPEGEDAVQPDQDVKPKMSIRHSVTEPKKSLSGSRTKSITIAENPVST